MPRFDQYLAQQPERTSAWEKAIWTAFEFGASAEQVERSYGVEDVAWTVTTFQLAEYFGWSITDIDDMTMDDVHKALAYIRATQRANKGGGGRRG